MREKTSPRDVLSQNLRTLMEARPDLGTIRKIAAASDSSLSNGKVGRIYAASHTTDIDTLQHLARVFDLEPWQLLVEHLNPKALPRLADAAVLAEIFDAVERKAGLISEKAQGAPDIDRLEQKRGKRELSPALARSMEVTGITKNESRKTGRVQKPRSRRGA